MSKIRVLVVEDNVMNMKLVKSLCRLHGLEVLGAGDAEQGIQIAKTEAPDLILMDIQLPGMDGLAATSLLKAEPRTKDIPIIALTSYAMRGDDRKAISAGCDGYITKPIDTRQFIGQLEPYIKHRSHPTMAGESLPGVSQQTKPFRPRILIVDDEPMNVKLLGAMLSTEGYDICHALDGQAALEVIQAKRIDLILLDIMMPVMDGYELTRRLKDDQNTAHIPVILVTALDNKESRSLGFTAGADEILTKPVNKLEILSRINSLLRFRQYQEQLALRIRSKSHFNDVDMDNLLARREERRQRILLVEDNSKDIDLFQAIIHAEPYDFIVTRSGEEALNILHESKVDLVLLDLLLPGMNGFQVCQSIKSDISTRDIQVVIITCVSDLESKYKGFEKGADDYLIKPIDTHEIRSRINALLRKKAVLDKLKDRCSMASCPDDVDESTGLYSEDYLKRYLELEIERSVSQKCLTGLMSLKIENLSESNHAPMDMDRNLVFRELTSIIQNAIREVDVLGWFNDERFLVVFPYANQAEIWRIKNKIQEMARGNSLLRRHNVSLDNLSSSVGVAFSPIHAQTVDQLIEHACRSES